MKSKLIIMSAAFAAIAGPVFANGPLGAGASPVDVIVQGHGQPGDAATATSNRNVTFRALDNGYVERTNKRFGTVSVINPRADFRRSRDNR